MLAIFYFPVKQTKMFSMKFSIKKLLYKSAVSATVFEKNRLDSTHILNCCTIRNYAYNYLF